MRYVGLKAGQHAEAALDPDRQLATALKNGSLCMLSTAAHCMHGRSSKAAAAKQEGAHSSSGGQGGAVLRPTSGGELLGSAPPPGCEARGTTTTTTLPLLCASSMNTHGQPGQAATQCSFVETQG